MSTRPVFVPSKSEKTLVNEFLIDFCWSPGFSPSQKQKNVKALHLAADRQGISPVLEVSSKSDEKLGQHLSSFHLKVKLENQGDAPLESVYQGSKVFEQGGPYWDLYTAEPRVAKRDLRLQESGRLIRFELYGQTFPLEPRSLFYDWLYLKAIYPHREWLHRLTFYAGFTDIEFNPAKSINCQARSCALFVTLLKRDLLDQALVSIETFARLMVQHNYAPSLNEIDRQPEFFAF